MMVVTWQRLLVLILLTNTNADIDINANIDADTFTISVSRADVLWQNEIYEPSANKRNSNFGEARLYHP